MAKIRRDDDPYKTRHLPPIQAPEPAAEPPRPEQKDAAEEPAHPRRQKGGTPDKKKPAKKQGSSNVIYNLLMAVCLVVFLVSGGVLAKRFYDDRQTENEFASLQAMIDTDAPGHRGGEQQRQVCSPAGPEQRFHRVDLHRRDQSGLPGDVCAGQ